MATIQLRRDTATNWTSVNPVLHLGEPGLEEDTGKLKFGDGTTAWTSLGYFAGSGGGGAVASVFGRTGAISATSGDYTVSEVTGAAPLASPALTGSPTAPTASPLTNDTQVATTAYTDAAVAVEVSRAEAAEALKAPLASPALTGTPTAPTKSALTNNTDIATTAYADAAVAVELGRAETAEALALPKAGGTLTGATVPAVVSLSQSAGSVAVNAALGNVFALTLTASGWTIANPTNPADGQVIRIRLIQDGTGSRTISWGSAYDWGSTSGSGNSAPTLTTTASKVDVLGFEYDAALTKWVYLSAPFPQGF